MSDVLSAVNGVIDLISGAPLKLGNINFTNYAIPERISFGGKQQVSVKHLIGGRKIVESIGYELNDPTWTGRFQGALAQSQARAVEAMTEAGLPVQLSYGGMLYTVVITSFTPNYERKYQIPYSITCTVISDDSTAGFLDSTLDDLVGADVLDSLGLGDLIGDVTLNTALSNVQGTLNTVGSLTGNPALSRISSMIGSTAAIADNISTAANTSLGAAVVGAVSTGSTSALASAVSLQNVISAANAAANSGIVSRLLTRAQKNINV